MLWKAIDDLIKTDQLIAYLNEQKVNIDALLTLSKATKLILIYFFNRLKYLISSH